MNDDHKEQFQGAIDHLINEISTLRTGRATPALVEDISVDAYDMKQPLKNVASISVLDAKTLAIEPWDKTIVQNIESAINNSQLGINPINDGKVIRLPLPELTTDRRQELIKVLHQKLEQGRIALRNIREDVRKMLDREETAGNMSEDEKYKFEDQLDTLIKEYNEEIKQIGIKKETDIQTV